LVALSPPTPTRCAVQPEAQSDRGIEAVCTISHSPHSVTDEHFHPPLFQCLQLRPHPLRPRSRVRSRNQLSSFTAVECASSFFLHGIACRCRHFGAALHQVTPASRLAL
jgi:hypothetical protein